MIILRLKKADEKIAQVHVVIGDRTEHEPMSTSLATGPMCCTGRCELYVSSSDSNAEILTPECIGYEVFKEEIKSPDPIDLVSLD